jgi:hypothetical protein
MFISETNNENSRFLFFFAASLAVVAMIFMSAVSLFAEPLTEVKSAMTEAFDNNSTDAAAAGFSATALFDYDPAKNEYTNSVSGQPSAGSEIKIIYKKSRREKVLSPKNISIYLYYSTDFGKSFNKVFLTAGKNGDYEHIFIPGPKDRQLQMAFCAYDRYGHDSWDSNFANNYTVNIITASELEKRYKFMALNESVK